MTTRRRRSPVSTRNPDLPVAEAAKLHPVMPVDDEDDYGRTMIVRPGAIADAVRAAEAVGHYLLMLEGPQAGKRVEIGAEPITIGRDPQQVLAFADAELSRRHARVSLVNGEAVAE